MSESLSTLLDLLTRSDFLIGVLAGLTGFVLVFFAPRGEGRSRLDWGLIMAAAAFVAVSVTQGRRLGLLGGLGVLALGGWLARPPRGSARAPFGWALIAIGAEAMIWRGGFEETGWLLVIAPAAIAMIGATLAAWATRLPQEWLGIMIAISAFGIWVTVPETEGARALLGASIPMALGTLRPVGAKLGYGGAFPLAGLLVWIVATGGEARPASIIGGWACIGALAILPHLRPPPSRFVESRRTLTVLLHAVLVLVASRIIGLWESAGLALVAATLVGVGVYLVLGLLPVAKADQASLTRD
ncbi:MAG: hypothetical protein WD895_01565 [Acidimicrobiia bacterium]